jgi:hypothetical protein
MHTVLGHDPGRLAQRSVEIAAQDAVMHRVLDADVIEHRAHRTS